MERLVWLLKEVENSSITPRTILDETSHSAVPLIKSLLREYLIVEMGRLDWDAVDLLEADGYPVDTNQLWVTTEKGAITFG